MLCLQDSIAMWIRNKAKRVFVSILVALPEKKLNFCRDFEVPGSNLVYVCALVSSFSLYSSTSRLFEIRARRRGFLRKQEIT